VDLPEIEKARLKEQQLLPHYSPDVLKVYKLNSGKIMVWPRKFGLRLH
jgi:hypothetical protein